MNTKRHLCYIRPEGLSLAYMLFGGVSVSASPQQVQTLLVFLESPIPSRFVNPQCFHKTSGALPNAWLWVSAYVSVSCWLEPLRGHL